MVEFAYYNIKNIRIKFFFLSFNYDYHFHNFFKKSLNFYFKSKLIKNLSTKLKDLINIYKETFFLFKTANNKSVKLWDNILNKKIWLNSKYIKIKQN